MKKTFTLFYCLITVMTALADDAPFSVVDGLFSATYKETMGLDYAPGAETFTVWAAKDDGPHYANGVVMTAFKDKL